MMKPIEPASRETADDEPFLQRFHRRKLAARRGEALPDEPPSHLLVPPDSVTPLEPEPEPLLTDEDMPPIESLTAESDYSGFLSPGVSEDLRRAALRRLWQVADTPFTDDLDIYAGDYTRFEPLGGLVTREMTRRLERTARRAAERLVEDQSAGDPAIDEGAENEPADTTAPNERPQQMMQVTGPEEETDAG